MTLYQRIKNRREQLKMSQEELATALGYKSRSTIAKIEAGENDIPQSKIEAFAKALHTTPAHLMGWEEHVARPAGTVLATRLKAAREENSLALKDAAALTGITETVLKDWEQNLAAPTPEELAALARLYDVSLDWLVGSTNVKTPIPTLAAHMDDADYRFTPEEEEEIKNFIEYIKSKSRK